MLNQLFWNLVVHYGETATIGPWDISCRIESQSENKPAYESWEDFMSGDITYSIEVPNHDDEELLPLVVVNSFTRESRPQSWKGLDLKVQSTLPLLGHSEKALAGWDEMTPTLTAMISLKLRS